MKNGWVITIIALVCWFILFGGIYTAAYFGLGIEKLDALKNFGKRTYGVVARKKPEDHRSIIYYFQVDGVQYTGSGGALRGNPEFDQLSVGDQVLVTYDEQYPLNSFLGDPSADAATTNTMAYLLAFIVTTAAIGQGLAVFLIIRYIRQKNRPKAM